MGSAGQSREYGGWGLSNSPWNQAVVQLACTYGTVQNCYGIGVDPTSLPLLGLLVWMDEADGVQTIWLHNAMPYETLPSALLKELQKFKSAAANKKRYPKRKRK